MNDLQQKVQQARQAGYSDDEIMKYLNKSSYAPKVKQALDAGYKQEDILGYLGGQSQDNLSNQFIQSSQAPEPKKSFWQKAEGAVQGVGNFIGANTLGKVGGELLANNKFINNTILHQPTTSQMSENMINQTEESNKVLLNAMKKARARGDMKSYKKLQQAMNSNSSPTMEDVMTGGQGFSTDKQIIGSAAQVAAAMLMGGTLGSGTSGALGASTAAKFLPRLGVESLLGAMTMGGGSAQKNKSGKDVLKSAATGAVSAAALMSAMEGLGLLGKKYADWSSKGTYRRIAGKTSATELAAGREDIAQGLLDRGVRGNIDDMIKQIESNQSNLADSLDEIISKHGNETIDLAPIKESLQGLKGEISKIPGENTSGIDKVLEDLGGKDVISVAEAQSLKKSLQGVVKDKFLVDIAGTKGAQKKLAQELRKAIEEKAPEVTDVNKELAFNIRAGKQLGKKVGTNSEAVSAFDLLLGGGGTLYNPGLGLAYAGRKVARTPKIATNMAQILYKYSKSPGANKALLKAIRQIILSGASR